MSDPFVALPLALLLACGGFGVRGVAVWVELLESDRAGDTVLEEDAEDGKIVGEARAEDVGSRA